MNNRLSIHLLQTLRHLGILGLLLLGPGTYIPLLRAEDPGHKQVLLLHSYHLGYIWTSNIRDGVIETLGHSNIDVDVRSEYLDWKHFPTEENLSRQLESLKGKYRNFPFNLVITSDNAATEFALKHRAELFPGVPIIFCGYNGYAATLIKGHRGVTGIAENLDGTGTLNIALRLLPDLKEVLVVTDDTETGRAVRAEIEACTLQFKGQLHFRFMGEGLATEEVIATAKAAGPEAFLLIGPFNRDRRGRFLDLWELAVLMRERGVKVPLFHLYEEAMGHGSLGGSVMSGRLQGEAAGRLAVRILLGEDVGRIPVEERPTVRSIVDHQEMQHFAIPMANVPPGCQVLNPPPSFYERNKTLVLSALVLSLLGMLVLTVVILSQFQNERLLRDSEARLRYLIQNMPVLICALDTHGCVIVWNRACEACTGHTAPEVVKQTAATTAALLRKEDYARFLGLIQGDGIETEAELSLVAKGGEHRRVRWFSESRLYPVPGWAGWVVGVDVTRQLEAEEHLRRSQRMESLGALAGGLAHDFGNLLATILASADLMEVDEATDDSRQRNLAMIRKVASRGTELVKQMMGFARAKPEGATMVNIHTLLGELAPMLDRTFPRDIRISLELGAKRPAILGESGQLMQILLNLALNARDAMPDGGHLSFWTQDEGESLHLWVQDTGIGMSPETQRRIFEPFFTTKEVGKGTGMGLAMVCMLIKNHAGSISVDSEPGKGTSFHLRFPCAASTESLVPV